jgi:hypothetical protein
MVCSVNETKLRHKMLSSRRPSYWDELSQSTKPTLEEETTEHDQKISCGKGDRARSIQPHGFT